MSTEPPKKAIVMDSDGAEASWEDENVTKKLHLDWNRCTGCNLCVPSCPANALTLGPIPSIATGAIKAPPLMIDHNKCVYCGICESVCPMSAIEITHEEKRLLQKDEYPEVKGSTIIKDNCIPCYVCEKVCPTQALSLEIEVPKKEDLVKYSGATEPVTGTIEIDKVKCTYCGLCEALCDAISIDWVEPNPEQVIPATDITVDLSKCDYCDLCRRICPSDAVKVTCTDHPPRDVQEVEISGKLHLDESKCVHCGWCAKVCPVEAIEVTPGFEGEIAIEHLERCDPVGCKACINICPTKVWYVPKDPKKRSETKIDVNEDFCIYCGACVESCPEKLISIKRKQPGIAPKANRPWTQARTRRIRCTSAGDTVPLCSTVRFIPQAQNQQSATKRPRKSPTKPDPKTKAEVKQRLEVLISNLRSAGVRRQFEVQPKKKRNSKTKSDKLHKKR